MKRVEAIIDSHDQGRAHNHAIINGSRRLRIAKGERYFGSRGQPAPEAVHRGTEGHDSCRNSGQRDL